MISCIVTTTGGIEEDIMKCMASTYIGDFNLDGKELRKKGLIGRDAPRGIGVDGEARDAVAEGVPTSKESGTRGSANGLHIVVAQSDACVSKRVDSRRLDRPTCRPVVTPHVSVADVVPSRVVDQEEDEVRKRPYKRHGV